MLGLLQFILIKPYYRNLKLSTVSNISNQIVQHLLKDDGATEKDLQKVLQLNVDNDICTIIYNADDQLLYKVDSLGESCIFNQIINYENNEISLTQSASLMNTFVDSANGEYTLNVFNTKSNQDMILYGKKIEGHFQNYYLYVNSPLEPIYSILNFYKQQYFLYTIIVLFVSTIISVVISRNLSLPISTMAKEANHLTRGDYSFQFTDSRYREVSELSKTLNEAKDKLGKIDTLRKELIANVSHDIKTPLTMIKAYAEMIKDISGENKEKREEHLSVIISEAEFLDRLVQDMRLLAMMQSGNYKLEMTTFDLHEMIEKIVKANQLAIEQCGIHLHVDVSHQLMCSADEVKIKQVIHNFLSNAIKNTDKGKNITVKAYYTKMGVKVEVINEGKGISKELLPYIWDRYYKINKEFSRNEDSTGLGLAIVKAILDTHHATYGVSSEEGKETVFYFELQQR